MNTDDPFAGTGSDRTIILPSPGRRGTQRSSGPTQTILSDRERSYGLESVTAISGINPLVAAANPLLNLAGRLRATVQHPDPSGLREALAQGVKTFEARARAAGVESETILAARYALCTLLDEIAASTPWGASGMWAKQSLLIQFHNEARGGEKFFQLLSKIAEKPATNRDLLELLYLCLTMGLEGRYRLMENGRSELEALRDRLAQLLRQQRGEYERDLSPRWQGTTTQRYAIFTIIPLWVIVSACGLILLTAYLGFSYKLNSESDPVFSKIQAIHAEVPPPRKVTSPQLPPPIPRLSTFLAPEIRQGLVAVHNDGSSSTVTLRGDGLFAPGSATVSSGFIPLLMRIATALKSVPGAVQIAGYTDSQPIRSARFPSNWHLSQARAEAVLRLLATVVAPDRLVAEGRADADPVASNDTAEGRARNRRVEITLFATQP
jgi:type VI secretion system protein ImpK